MKRIKQIDSLSDSGFGAFVSLGEHAVLGLGFYELPLDNCVLFIFEKGVLVRFCADEKCVRYADILNIKSHISAETFSNASKDQDVNVVIPMDVECLLDTVTLEVQLLVYSRLLIVLTEQRSRNRI